MANSYVQYTGNGSTTNFSLTFPYLDREDVTVKVDNVDTAFTWINDTTVSISPAPASGKIVELRRHTPSNAPIVDFQDGAIVTEEQLDSNAKQGLFVTQEAEDVSNSAMIPDSAGVWDSRSKRIKDVADPTLDQDAATKHYVDSTTPASAAAAAASAVAAASSASAASTSKDAAHVSELAAAASAAAAAASFDDFQNRYLGAYASPPTQDHSGNPLDVGDLYFDTGLQRMRQWDGANWISIQAGMNQTDAEATFPKLAWQRAQCVNYGPVDTSGFPSFFPASASGLTLTTQNLSSTYPLVLNAAKGVQATNGLPDTERAFSTSNKSWTLSNNTTSYIAATLAAGVITPVVLTLAPIYQFGGTPSTTNGQFTFNISEMRGYLGNGTTAPQTSLVFLGEAVTSGGNITSVKAYAYNGKYDSGFSTGLPNTVQTKNHNIGTKPQLWSVIFQNNSADGGFSVGDQLEYGRDVWYVDAAAALRPPVVRRTATIASILFSTNGVSSVNIGTAAGAVLTGAKWDYKLIIDRGW